MFNNHICNESIISQHTYNGNGTMKQFDTNDIEFTSHSPIFGAKNTIFCYTHVSNDVFFLQDDCETIITNGC